MGTDYNKWANYERDLEPDPEDIAREKLRKQKENMSEKEDIERGRRAEKKTVVHKPNREEMEQHLPTLPIAGMVQALRARQSRIQPPPQI